MSNQPFALLRPIRAAGLVFAALVALVAVCAPFIQEVDAAVFVLAGPVYSFLLALFGVGIVLALPSRMVLWWLVSGLLLLVTMAGVWLAGGFEPALMYRASAAVFLGIQAVIGGWLLAGCAVAGWGWVRYTRARSSARRG